MNFAGTVAHLMAYHFPSEVGVEDELEREDDDRLTGDDPDFFQKEL